MWQWTVREAPRPGGRGLHGRSLWDDIAGRPLGDELLEWAPDLFAFTDLVLHRSEAYRFAVSPPEGASWPPSEMPDWSRAIADASAGWCAWVEGDGTQLPGLVAEEWAVVRERSATTLDELATGGPLARDHVGRAHRSVPALSTG
jgi:hypothetical protein